MNNAIEIRKTLTEELTELKVIKDECIRLLNDQGFDFSDSNYPSTKDLFNKYSYGELYTILNGVRVIGSVVINSAQNPAYKKGEWMNSNFRVIHGLMIRPCEQGNGYARNSMMKTENLMAKSGIKSLRLAVYVANKSALALYQSMGYKKTGLANLLKGPALLFEKQL